jgi:hypothetical protein
VEAAGAIAELKINITAGQRRVGCLCKRFSFKIFPGKFAVGISVQSYERVVCRGEKIKPVRRFLSY